MTKSIVAGIVALVLVVACGVVEVVLLKTVTTTFMPNVWK